MADTVEVEVVPPVTKGGESIEVLPSSPRSITSTPSMASSSTSPTSHPTLGNNRLSTLTSVTAVQLPPLPRFKDDYSTEAEVQRAKEMLNHQRLAQGQKKKVQKNEPYIYKEVNPILDEVISNKDTPASPGLVQALIDLGGDVQHARQASTKIWNKVLRRKQEVELSDFLTKATQNCNLEVVWILSQRAGDANRTKALPFAIKQGGIAKTRVLLDSGADASAFHEEFLTAVEQNSDEMVFILLRATKGPCPDCLSKGLVKAAANGSSRNTSLLVEKGADADFEDGAALQRAIIAGREDLANAIALCEKQPSSNSFDTAVGLAYSKLAGDAEKQYRMVELCLKGDARGSITNDTLVKATISEQSQLINILLEYGASVDHDSGAALKHAVSSKQLKLLKTLLRGKPLNTTLAMVISSTTLEDLGVAYEIIDILLSAGLRGDAVSKTLVRVIEHPIQVVADTDYLRLLQLILEKGNANVNFDGGKSLKIGATKGMTHVLKLLLQHGPSLENLNAAFLLAMELNNSAQRLEVIAMILQAGASGTVVDEALLVSAGSGKYGVELTSALLKQSSVDYENGKALCVAINTCCLGQMQALMLGQPSQSTLAAAWAEADGLQDDKFRYQAFQILLAAGVEDSLPSGSLITAATRGKRGLQVCELLLQHGASPDYEDGACVVSAANGLHLDTLCLLAGSVTSASVFTTAFDAISDGEGWLAPRGLEVVHFLLESGASGPGVDKAFCKAARLYEPDALELLASSINPEAVDVALATITQTGKDWLLPNHDHLWVIHSLLDWGAEGDPVNVGLLMALNAYARGFASADLIDTLLYVGAKADVNFRNGESIQIAIRNGNASLLEKLASCGATKETLTLAFSEALIAKLDEHVLYSLIEIFTNNKGAKPELKTTPEGYPPHIFACLAAYPRSERLVKQLAEVECDLEAQIESFTYYDEVVGAEDVPALVWALSQTEKPIASAVIGALIDAKANTNFTTKKTKVTPLILAAKYSRSDLVEKLLEFNAEVSAKDQFERSALFYASRNGDYESVNALLKAGSPLNDGSLHEAAKNLHSSVVALLIEGKHHPDTPGRDEEYGGRTALQEMALMCDCSQSAKKIEKTLLALAKGKANPLLKTDGKNALFYALDNPNPVPITRAVLDFVMAKHMTSDENVYTAADPETGTKYYYSPKMYISKGFSQDLDCYDDELMKLLMYKGAVDRYYAEEGAEQPVDAVGMAQAVIDAEIRRKVREERVRQNELDYQSKLLREKQSIERKEATDEVTAEDPEAEKEARIDEGGEDAPEKPDVTQRKTSLQNTEVYKARMSQLEALHAEQEAELRQSFVTQVETQQLAFQTRMTKLASMVKEQNRMMAQRQMEAKDAVARHNRMAKEWMSAQREQLIQGAMKQKR